MRHNLFGTWNILTLFCILYSEKEMVVKTCLSSKGCFKPLNKKNCSRPEKSFRGPLPFLSFFQQHPWLAGVENDNSIDIAEWVTRISKMPTPNQ